MTKRKEEAKTKYGIKICEDNVKNLIIENCRILTSDQMRVEEVREILGDLICLNCMELQGMLCTYPNQPRCNFCKATVKALFSLKKDGKPMLGIISDDQSLPVPIDNQYLGSLTVMSTEDMKANFRRVIMEE